MSTLIADGAPPTLGNEESIQPRTAPVRRHTSSSFVQQKLQTALSQAEKSLESSNFGQSENSNSQSVLQLDRSVARYRSAAAVVSFTDPGSAFSYTASFMPGVHFYTFLAAKEAVAPSKSARSTTSTSIAPTTAVHPNEALGNPKPLTARKQNAALKLNVPDTILYGETGRAVWIYTDKEGYVQRLTEFSDKQVLDKFATLSDDQHLVVYKEPVATMTSANHHHSRGELGTGGSSLLVSQGNQLRLLNLGEVRSLLNGVMAMHKSFALQQFVKCNGAKAFVQRAVFEAGKPAHAWMISNVEPFRDPNAPASPTSGMQPQTTPRVARTSSTSTIVSEDKSSSIPVVNRLCTSVQTDKACTFVKLTERGCAVVSELNLRIVRYIEQRLRIQVQTLVADFVKDVSGEWWLLQVKAFQVVNRVHPGRPLPLSMKQRVAYLNYRDTNILDEDDAESFDGDERGRKSRHRFHRRAMVPLSQRNIHKLVQCKCCLAAYPSSELSFKMTLKMISDMLLRIRSRLPPEKTLSLLSFARDLPESAVAYESWSVCSYCYAIYERDQQLQRIETKFSAALGLPNSKIMAEGLGRIQEQTYSLDPTISVAAMPPQLTLCRLILVINAIYDIPPELFIAEQENARIEAAADEVAAAEGRKRTHRSSHGSRLYLRINALGYTECIPINADAIMEASEKAPVGARRRRDSNANSVSDDEDGENREDSDQTSPLTGRRKSSFAPMSRGRSHANRHLTRKHSDTNYWLPTNLIRTIPFFAPRTPLQSKLKETSGITPFLTEDNSVRVQLIRATEPPLQDPQAVAARRRPKNRRAALVPEASSMSELVSQMRSPTHSIVLGSTKIRMTQFRSSYVTKIDYYACMAITGEMLNIKGNIGLERVRYVDSKLLNSQHRLRAYNGIYIPDESYTTGDALSSEWMDCFSASSLIVKRPPLISTSTELETGQATSKANNSSTTRYIGFPRRGTRPTSSRASLMDEDEEMDKELEQMIERANSKQQQDHHRRMSVTNNLNQLEDALASTTATHTALKQDLLRESITTSSKSALQMAMLLNKPVISPRSELTDDTSSVVNPTSMILPSPRNRKWMWSLVVLLNQAHNLQSREHPCCRWECHYSLFAQRRSALERTPVSSRTRTLQEPKAVDTRTNQPPTHLDVQFNCTHKFWLAGTTLDVQAYLRNNPSVKLFFRNDMYASTRSDSEGEYYSVLSLSKLLQNRGFDTTVDIVAAYDDPALTPREAAAISRMSPYLSLSVQLSRASIGTDQVLKDNQFVKLGCTAEGLQVLKKIS